MFTHFKPFFNNKPIWATGLVFVAAGIMLGTWSVLIPYIKTKFSLGESELGLLLLCLPAGATLANPFSVSLIRRFGLVPSTILSHFFTAMMFVMPVFLPNIYLVAFSLFLSGASFSCLNITMNTCASELERVENIRVISTMHGLWSLGAMLGSAITGMIVGSGIKPPIYMAILFALHMLFIYFIKKPLSEIAEPGNNISNKKKAVFIWPNRMLWVLIVIGLCVSLAEGSMIDWSGVYMREIVHAPEIKVGWGFAIYAFFMAGGRLLGDGLIGKFGSRKLLQYCGTLTSMGLFVLAFKPNMEISLFGFMLTGAGVSVGAPILYAESAKVPGLPTGAGLATFNTFAMMGFLGGPAFIGFMAEAWSLPAAFGVVGLGAVVWAVISKWKLKDGN